MTIPKEVSDFLESRYESHSKIFKTTENTTIDLNKLSKEAAYLTQVTLPLAYFPFGIKVNTSMYNFVVEPLKNARVHSDSSEPFQIGFWCYTSREGIICAYNDGGNYFKNPEVKKTWEDKINLDKHITNIYGIGCGMGRELLFLHGDLIHIDTETATLYTGLKTTNEVFFEKIKKQLI